MGMAAILIIWTNFRSAIPLSLHKKFDFDCSSGFWEDVWKRWMMDGR